MNERKIMVDVIKLFEQHRCLWDTSSENYRHNGPKNIAWKALLKKYKEIHPDACTIDVKNKIANMRSGYRREWRKMQAYGPNSTDLYRPHLWYFNLMSFLKEQPNSDGQYDACSMSYEYSTVTDPLCGDSDEESVNEIDVSDVDIKVEKCSPEPEDPIPLSTNKTERKLLTEGETPPKLRRNTIKKHKYVNDQLENSVTAIKINPFTLYIDQQLDNITKYQRQIAEKLISDVLFLAKTENLTMESKIETYKTQTKVETAISGSPQKTEDAESTESEIILCEDNPSNG